MNLTTTFFFIMLLLSSSARAFQNIKLISSGRMPQENLLKRSISSVFNRSQGRFGLLAAPSGEGFEHRSNSSLFSSAAALSVSITGGAIIANSNTTSCEHDEIFSEDALKYDTYGGITIDGNSLVPSNGAIFDAEAFAIKLKKSLEVWKKNGNRGIWINIPTGLSSVVPLCIEMGFDFQYAKSGMLVMTNWLPEETESRLPHGPTHQVGIGAIILHPISGKMLVVQEKTGPAAKRKLWKMPTGLTDPGEDVIDAAVREAKEETGLDVKFDRIICMRQAHGGIFNQSDMFVVCLLELDPKYKEALENGKEVPLVPQEEEIAMIEWMELKDFCDQDLWQGSPLYGEMNNAIVRAASRSLGELKQDKGIVDSDSGDKKQFNSDCGFIAKKLPVGFRPGSNTIYLSRL